MGIAFSSYHFEKKGIWIIFCGFFLGFDPESPYNDCPAGFLGIAAVYRNGGEGIWGS